MLRNEGLTRLDTDVMDATHSIQPVISQRLLATIYLSLFICNAQRLNPFKSKKCRKSQSMIKRH